MRGTGGVRIASPVDIAMMFVLPSATKSCKGSAEDQLRLERPSEAWRTGAPGGEVLPVLCLEERLLYLDLTTRF